MEDEESSEEYDLLSSVQAMDAILLNVFSPGSAAEAGFPPEYTHQAFPNEEIQGYDGLNIDININDLSMHWDVKICYGSKDEGATDIVNGISPLVPRGTPFTINGEKDEPSTSKDDVTENMAPGEEVLRYKVRPRDSTKDLQFVLKHALPSDKTAVKYHQRVQKLAPWFIETGDDVDVEDGEWEMLYLYRVEDPATSEASANPRYHFAGYYTIFAFSNPLKGKCLRVCQALILPTYQRQGHGQRILSHVYEMARASKVVYEVTIEDPAPGFTAMRNLTDAKELQRLLASNKTVASSLSSVRGFQGLSDKDLDRLHSLLKLPKKQIHLAFECIKQKEAAQQEEDGCVEITDGKDVQTQFRLMVKRRLAKECRSSYVIKGALQKEEFQAALNETFQDLNIEYQAMAKRLRNTDDEAEVSRKRLKDEQTN